MDRRMFPRTLGVVTALGLAAAFLGPPSAEAHCDSLDGPVVTTAKTALEKGDILPVLKWVRAEDEPAINLAFGQAVAVRRLGPEARTLADQYFFETLVRIHRQGEGEPYTGLKPAGSADPGIARADRALEQGSADTLVGGLSRDLDAGTRRRFARVIKTRKRADESVALGREYVEAYVDFIHYVQAIQAALSGTPAHAGSDSTAH